MIPTFWLLGCVAATDGTAPDSGTTHTDTGVEQAPGETGESPDDTAADTADDEADYAAFYADGSLQEVRLTLSTETIQALNRQVRTGAFEYLPGGVEVNGRSFANVGVRIKGSSTLRDFDTKPSLKIKFNSFEAGQDYGGMERITLNNMVEDSTQTKEVLAYRVFREMGFWASHANHAAVYVNDALYGLYTNLETPDDDWLKPRFANPDGDLWEANDYADFSRRSTQYWESVSGIGDTTRLDAVVAALESDDPYGSTNTLVNIEQFERWWVTRLITGDVDGYPYSLNDCYLYANPDDADRFVFIPWGVDESWNARAPQSWRNVSGDLAYMCLKNDACEADLLVRAGEQLDLFATLDASSWLAAERTLIAAMIAADTRRTFSVGEVERAEDALASNLTTIPADLRREMGL